MYFRAPPFVQHAVADNAKAVSIESLVAGRGVDLHRDGGLLIGVCPLHGIKVKAKLQLDPQRHTWTCSACDIKDGGPVDFVMKSEGVSRKHASEMLRSGKVHLDRQNTGPLKGAIPKQTTVRRLDLPFKEGDSDAQVLSGVVHFYQQTLTHHDQAKVFLEARGLRHPSLAEHFKLGVANKTLGLKIPIANRLVGRQLRDRLRALGVFRMDTGHEALNGCLVVPLFDFHGNICNLYGRRVDRARKGSEAHNWTDNSRRGLLNPQAFKESELVITSSITDALTCWAHGLIGVTAIHGLEGPTEDLVGALKNGSIKKVTFVMRRTKASTKFTDKLAEQLASMGITVFRGLLPHDTDVSEFAAAAPDPAHGLLQVVRTAEWLAGVPPEQKPVPRRPEDLPDAPVVPDAPEPAKGQPGATDDELVHVAGDRRWRVRGLLEQRHVGVLKLNVLVNREGAGFHVDSFDLYSARHRVAFTKQAASELGLEEDLIRKDIGTVLLIAEAAQAELLRRNKTTVPIKVELTPDERDDALQLLRDPKLLDRVLDGFAAQGIVGEKDNLLLGFLAVTSRKLRRPLGVVIQSSSAAGKSSLMEAVLSVVPEEDRVSYSAMTGQSLFYAPGSDLKHKVLAIAEEEGASRASYSLKLLQSEGSLKIASTGKDPGSGRLVSQEYRVEGPVALLLTTTSITVDEELLNRCVILTVDESPEQTKRIHGRQRQAQTLEGVLASGDRLGLLRQVQNAQRVLRPLAVVNPHVDSVVFADLRVRARRDHQKLLTLIETIAFVHQAQRPLRRVEHEGRTIEYIEAETSDVELAEGLLRRLGAIGIHDLPPQTVRVLGLIQDYVAEQGKPDEPVRFTRRQLRDALGLGDTQLWTHLRRLVELEYVMVQRSGLGRGLVYELALVATCSYDPNGSADIRCRFGPDSGDIRAKFGPLNPLASDSISGTSDAAGGADDQKRTSMGSRSNGVVRVRRP